MAKVFVAEDNSLHRELLDWTLSGGGHELIFMATSRDEALSAIATMQGSEIEVAILDGNLGRSNKDGEQVAEELRERVPGIKIISYSGEENQSWGDANLAKGVSPKTINQTIESVLGEGS